MYSQAQGNNWTIGFLSLTSSVKINLEKTPSEPLIEFEDWEGSVVQSHERNTIFMGTRMSACELCVSTERTEGRERGCCLPQASLLWETPIKRWAKSVIVSLKPLIKNYLLICEDLLWKNWLICCQVPQVPNGILTRCQSILSMNAILTVLMLSHESVGF